MEIIIASNNLNKVAEIKEKFKIEELNYPIYSLNDIDCEIDVLETGSTFEQNALLKAQEIAKIYPNYMIIADDSGLEINALNKQPGVYSARYASDDKNYQLDKDQANIEKVLRKMKTQFDKSAQFITLLCIIKPNSVPFFIKGEVKGEILTKKRGNNGFGYDPIFSANGLQSFAEMTTQEKLELSHRSIAIDKLIEYLKNNG